MPVGTLIEMGSKNTYLVGESCTTRGHQSEDNPILGGSSLVHTYIRIPTYILVREITVVVITGNIF